MKKNEYELQNIKMLNSMTEMKAILHDEKKSIKKLDEQKKFEKSSEDNFHFLTSLPPVTFEFINNYQKKLIKKIDELKGPKIPTYYDQEVFERDLNSIAQFYQKNNRYPEWTEVFFKEEIIYRSFILRISLLKLNNQRIQQDLFTVFKYVRAKVQKKISEILLQESAYTLKDDLKLIRELEAEKNKILGR